ncbi:MAG: glutamate racemase [Cyanobacteriota bacterium]|nr:glutamate racemase [Cyanobacteriota bacterium]
MSLLVGLFDSGLGGLTVLRQVRALHPTARCLYLGDTARVPYGQRSTQEIRAIAAEVVHWLRLQGVDVLLMACNTSNALALDVAETEAGVPVLGLIDSVAAELGKGRVGVLATPATAASGAYRRAIQALHPSSSVLEIGCPAFVPLIEAGDLEAPELRHAAEAYLHPLLEAEVQTIVLGCTHYPLLAPLLAPLLPEGVRLVDPARAAARRLGPLLLQPPAECELASPSTAGRNGATAGSGGSDGESVTYCVTGPAEAFACAAHAWLGERPAVRSVNLQSPARVL